MERWTSQMAPAMRPISVHVKHNAFLAITSGVATFFVSGRSNHNGRP